MADDDMFFAAPPPAGEAPAVEDVGDGDAAPILLGEAPPSDYAPMGDAFLGDVNEADAFAAPPADNAFAAPPAGDGDMFGAPPADAGGYDAFGAPPPAEDAPIILGGPPPDMPPPDMMGVMEPVVDENAGPSPMQKWNEEWAETLKTRKDEENQTKADMLEEARTELEAFQEARKKKKEARMAKNREDEQTKLEAIAEDLQNDSSWQRCCKMIELQHDSTEKAEDVKRMRDTLIALKNNQGKAAELSQ